MPVGGKSGAIMFFSGDQRYIVKQMEGAEAAKLQRIVKGYEAHMLANPDSMLLRIVSCCSVVMCTLPATVAVAAAVAAAGTAVR